MSEFFVAPAPFGAAPAQRSRWRWNLVAFVLGFVGVAVIAIAATWIHFVGWPRIPRWPQRFDAQVWRDASESGISSVRLSMLDDLVNNNGLIGMPRADVEALLGPPKTPRPYCGGFEGHRDASLWRLCPYLGTNFSQYLAIVWDPSGRAAGSRVVHD